jgi:hypothetical protein
MRQWFCAAAVLFATLCIAIPPVWSATAEVWSGGLYDDESNDLTQLETLSLAIIPAATAAVTPELVPAFVVPQPPLRPVRLQAHRSPDTRAPPSS